MSRKPFPSSALLLPAGGLALLVGMDAGLTLAGAPAPVPIGSGRLALLHGPLMVLGFLGTVIALERATALRTGWAMLAPASSALGALALIFLPDATLGRLLLAQGMFLLTCVYVALFRRNHDLTVAAQGLGSLLAGCAALLLTRVELAVVLPLLLGFIVLTIAAERVELARLGMPPTAYRTLLAFSVPVAVLAVTSMVLATDRLLGLAILILTGWLVRNDVARRLVLARGLPRYSAVAMMLGYYWLAVAGLTLLLAGAPSGSAYDIAVHTTFLGFALSMVLAHAPVILPAVLRIQLPYHPIMWLPLALLHLTLAWRVLSLIAGDIGSWHVALVGNVVALLTFVLTAVITGIRAARKPERGRSPDAPSPVRTPVARERSTSPPPEARHEHPTAARHTPAAGTPPAPGMDASALSPLHHPAAGTPQAPAVNTPAVDTMPTSVWVRYTKTKFRGPNPYRYVDCVRESE